MLIDCRMSESGQELKSDHADDQAADKALKSVSVNFVEQLNLFDTTLHLFKMGGLTPLEVQKLQNNYVTELERKQYLMTVVIPSKGHYKGMALLKQALKQTEQIEILSILEKEFENAVLEITANRSDIKQTICPVQATTNGSCSGIISTVCNESGLVCNLDRPAISNNSSANTRNNNISVHSPVEQVPSQPQSDDVSIHNLMQPQSVSLDSQGESQPRPEDEVFSFEEQQFQSHSDDLASHSSRVAVEQNFLLETDGTSSHKSPVAAVPQLKSHSGDFSSHKSLEQKIQLESDGIPSHKPAVTAEQQFQLLSNEASSQVTVMQQCHPQSNSSTSHASSSLIAKQEPQTPSDDTAPLDSLTQQQSGSQVTPYFKVRLPPMYSGTITLALTPSSYPTTDQIPDSSIPKSPEQSIANTPPGDSHNNSLDHDNRATTSLVHDNRGTTSLGHNNRAATSLDRNNGATSIINVQINASLYLVFMYICNYRKIVIL